MGVKNGKFSYYVGSLEKWPQKKEQYIWENCLKRGAWTGCRSKGGGLAKKRAMHFL